MSIRLWVSALKLQEIKDWRGSKKKELLNELLEKLDGIMPDGEIEEEDAELKVLAREKLEAYINGTLKAQEEPETTVEVLSVYSMALQAETNPWEDHEVELEWAYGDLDELYRDCLPRFQGTEHLLEHIIGGRPFLATDFDPESNLYSFLNNGEIKDLASKMQEVYSQCAEIVDAGDLNEQDFDSGVLDTMEYMLSALTVAAESGDDIFIFFS